MRLGNYPLGTMRENPSNVESTSQRLLVRAGMISAVGPGLFTYTHFLLRTLQKIEAIVREEMNRAGAVEIEMPILQPMELWAATGRWDDYIASGTMLSLKNRRGNELGLAPTAEEIVTAWAARMVKSYRDLPFTVYQIKTKFRDEMNPRAGLIRTTEFPMKDAYSFDLNEEGMDASYKAQRAAYERIFERCGLTFLAVEADSGPIGGGFSHEFMVPAEAGEDRVIICDCGYMANTEKAEAMIPLPEQDSELKECHEEQTPNARSVDDLVELFGIPASNMVETILYQVVHKDGTEEVVAVLMRGDRHINEIKLGNHLEGVKSLELADPMVVVEKTNADVGFAGPIGLKVRIIADETVRPLKNFLCGANKTEVHVLDVNHGRDFPEPEFADLVTVDEGDGCARCKQGILRVQRGIEIGHLFKLGTKYSHEPDTKNPLGLGATYEDANGVIHDILMGCYGIGITRIAAAAIELSNDDNGIIWPLSIAPYEVVIVTAGVDIEAELEYATSLYRYLQCRGVEVVWDDREGKRIGEKLAEADLIGYPYKVIIGRGLAKGVIDLKGRKDGKITNLPKESAADAIEVLIKGQR